MKYRNHHRAGCWCLSALIFSLLLILTLLQGCGSSADGSKNYHTVTAKGESWYVMDREYTGDFDLQWLRFSPTPVDDLRAGELLVLTDGEAPVPENFSRELLLDRADYEDFCRSWGLSPAFPAHGGRFAVLACTGMYSTDCELQLADVELSGQTVTLYLRERFSGVSIDVWDSRGFVLTVPVPKDVTELRVEDVYDRAEAENLERYGNPWGTEDETRVPEKPVIYLYPKTETAVTVKLDCDGELTCTYPAYGEGWAVTAAPDGTLTDAAGQSYSYLYWEGLGEGAWDFSRGFCVRGEDTAAFLEEALDKLGLTRREANEFIVYWLPRMEGNAWNLISFQGAAYTDHARLTVSPAPDTVLRVFMAWEALEEPVDVEPQILSAPERTGFTLVEWGGAER